ncbi:MAG TPA: tripartite tricarboxylate transporter substrate binding protein [Pseudolabrys sp.]|nr:tripartite tricarboxylate transporter substrate binding protein [Pseudolabrys sp.]
MSRFTALLLAALALLAQPARADDYPSRPIRLIVGFAAGSSGDVVARIVAHKLADLLKQNVVVEDKPGASSMVATDYVARSSKDGYTLMFATIATVINMTMMQARAPNIEKDMTPIALIGSIPNILVVNPKLGVADVKGLIALAKQKPDELLYGASGIGSGPHLATELFKQMAGVKMTGVLYPGSGQTAVDLISGRIQVMFAPAPTVLGLIKDGRVKALATTETKRSSVAPDLPTVAEAALPGYAAGLWFGILGPAGLPQPVVDTLSKAANTTLQDKAVLRELQSQGLNPAGGSADDFAHFIASEAERWAKVIASMDAAKTKKDGAAH